MINPDAVNDHALRSALAESVTTLALADPPEVREMQPLTKRMRRGAPVYEESLARVSLVRVDGVLRWSYERPQRTGVRRRAARRASRFLAGEEIHSFSVREQLPSAIGAALSKLDNVLTPERGLRRLVGGKLVAAASAAADSSHPTKERTLLLVHGTFSKGDMFVEELQATKPGRSFLAWAESFYDQILTFDHPTVAVSPMLNALDLEVALAGYQGRIDVVCHSRGGLVTAWWLRNATCRVDRVIFVASTLEGTSLADPSRLADALDGFANIADLAMRAATATATVVPAAGVWLGGAAGLMKVVGGLLHAGAQAPLSGAIGLVPGLAAQSPRTRNPELERLHTGTWATNPECFAVLSNFEPGGDDAAWWQFWKRWRKPGATIADALVDHVFDADNDLVVDTASMIRVRNTAIPLTRRKDFQTSGDVHHINYFVQPGTIKFLGDTLRG